MTWNHLKISSVHSSNKNIKNQLTDSVETALNISNGVIYIENSNNNMCVEVSDKKLHHLNQVLRLRDGDKVNISDGKGLVSYGNFINNHVEIKNSRMYQRQNSLKIFVPYLREKSRFRFLIENSYVKTQ